MAVRGLLLDTSAYAAFKRGQAAAVTAVRRAPQLLLSTIVLGELLAGFELGTQRERNQAELTAFLQSPRVQTPALTEETAVRYAHIYVYLRQAGTPIPNNDLWIAATALETGAELLTADQHFRQVPHILVRYLPPAD